MTKKSDIDTINEQYSLAVAFLDEKQPKLIDLAHYIVDNALEKLMKLIGKDKIPNFDPQKHPIKKRYWEFPQLVNEVLMKFNPNLSSIKDHLIVQHKERNFFQHNIDSLTYSLREPVAKDYLELFKQVLVELKYFQNLPKPNVPHSRKASGRKLEDMLAISPNPLVATPLIKKEFGKEFECIENSFILNIRNNGPYTLNGLEINWVDPISNINLPLYWKRLKKPHQKLAYLKVGHSENIICFRWVQPESDSREFDSISDWERGILFYYTWGANDEPEEEFASLDTRFTLEFLASNADPFRKKLSLRSLFGKDLNFSIWKEKIILINLLIFALELDDPWDNEIIKNNSDTNDPQFVKEVQERFDGIWTDCVPLDGVDLLVKLSKDKRDLIEKYVKNRIQRETHAKGVPDMFDVFGWRGTPKNVL